MKRVFWTLAMLVCLVGAVVAAFVAVIAIPVAIDPFTALVALAFAAVLGAGAAGCIARLRQG